jgi:hypothetical protein
MKVLISMIIIIFSAGNCFGLGSNTNIVQEVTTIPERYKNSHPARKFFFKEALYGSNKILKGYYFINSVYYIDVIVKRSMGYDEFVNNVLLWCINDFYVKQGKCIKNHIPKAVNVDIKNGTVYREYVEGSEGFDIDLNSFAYGTHYYDWIYPKEYKKMIRLFTKAGIYFRDLDDPFGSGTKNILVNEDSNNKHDENWYFIDFEKSNIDIDYEKFKKFISKNKEKLHKHLGEWSKLFYACASYYEINGYKVFRFNITTKSFGKSLQKYVDNNLQSYDLKKIENLECEEQKIIYELLMERLLLTSS